MSDHNSSVATIKPLPSSGTLPAAVRAVNPVIFCHPISFMVALADVGESTGVIGINGGAVAALSMPPPQTLSTCINIEATGLVSRHVWRRLWFC